METEVDRSTADRAALIAIVVRLQATVLELQRRIAELEGPAQPGGPPRIPGLKPKANRKPSQPKPPRKPRRHGFARARMTPTHRVERVMENCPDCGTHRSGAGPSAPGRTSTCRRRRYRSLSTSTLARTVPGSRGRVAPPAGMEHQLQEVPYEPNAT